MKAILLFAFGGLALLVGDMIFQLGDHYLLPSLPGGRGNWRETVEWFRLDSAQVVQGIKRLEAEVSLLQRENLRLQERAEDRWPKGLYIVVDTHTNILMLWEGEKLLRRAVCSTGSGRELVVGNRRWVFETPKGQFKVLSKHSLPVWIKPDWAFHEEGEKPPPAGSSLRLEEGVLGEYALSFGNGYLIHGTLYKRLLGQKVTHGCVRLDDEDLEFVYDTAQVGTPIHIF